MNELHSDRRLYLNTYQFQEKVQSLRVYLKDTLLFSAVHGSACVYIFLAYLWLEKDTYLNVCPCSNC